MKHELMPVEHGKVLSHLLVPEHQLHQLVAVVFCPGVFATFDAGSCLFFTKG
jgi:hypothetical protein